MQDVADLKTQVAEMRAEQRAFKIIGDGFSGSWPTFAYMVPNNGGGGMGGTAYTLTLCDGTTITVQAANITPP